MTPSPFLLCTICLSITIKNRTMTTFRAESISYYPKIQIFPDKRKKFLYDYCSITQFPLFASFRDEELAQRFNKIFSTQPIAAQKNPSYHIPENAYSDNIDREVRSLHSMSKFVLYTQCCNID